MVLCRLLTEPSAQIPVVATEHLACLGPADKAALAAALVAFEVAAGTRTVTVSLVPHDPAMSADDPRGKAAT